MAEQNEKGHGWVHIVLTLIALCWGFNNMAMKIGFTFVSSQQFGGIRMLLVFPFMLYFAFFSPSRVPFEKKDTWRIALIGVIGLGLFQILFPRGIGETSAPLGGILMATMPVHVLILSLLFRLERTGWRSIVGVLLTLTGLAIITLTNADQASGGETTIRGVIFVVLAELGFAINTTFLRPYMKKYPLLQVTGLAMSVSVIIYVLVYLSDMIDLVRNGVPWQVWPLTIYSGFVAFLLANILWNTSIAKIGSTQVAVYGNLPTVFVLILSALILRQTLTGWQLIGSLIILSGVVLVQFRKHRERSPSAAPRVVD